MLEVDAAPLQFTWQFNHDSSSSVSADVLTLVWRMSNVSHRLTHWTVPALHKWRLSLWMPSRLEKWAVGNPWSFFLRCSRLSRPAKLSHMAKVSANSSLECCKWLASKVQYYQHIDSYDFRWTEWWRIQETAHQQPLLKQVKTRNVLQCPSFGFRLDTNVNSTATLPLYLLGYCIEIWSSNLGAKKMTAVEFIHHIFFSISDGIRSV